MIPLRTPLLFVQIIERIKVGPGPAAAIATFIGYEHSSFVMNTPHSQTPWAFIWTLVIGLSIVLFAAVLYFPLGQGTVGRPRQTAMQESVDQQIQKVGFISLQSGPATAAAPRTGEEIYKAQCAACHATGVSGAPKFGDAAAWAARIATGFDALVLSATKGKNAMNAQVNDMTSEYEVARAVQYITTAAGGKFPEPAAPAASAPAASPATVAK